MGEGSQWIAASEGSSGSKSNWRDCCQAHHVGIFPQENRSGSAGEVGEDQGCEEGGLKPSEPVAPAAGAGMFELAFHVRRSLP
jgi:hypothetical protein